MKNELEKIIYKNIEYHLKWTSSNILPNSHILQVSGYVLNDENKLLIVNDGNNWTIPGGKPFENEDIQATLEREVKEEACVIIKNPQVLGYITVHDNRRNIIGYQIRFFSRIKNICNFKKRFETIDRNFISFDEIPQYINWHQSQTFMLQLNELNKCLK